MYTRTSAHTHARARARTRTQAGQLLEGLVKAHSPDQLARFLHSPLAPPAVAPGLERGPFDLPASADPPRPHWHGTQLESDSNAIRVTILHRIVDALALRTPAAASRPGPGPGSAGPRPGTAAADLGPGSQAVRMHLATLGKEILRRVGAGGDFGGGSLHGRVGGVAAALEAEQVQRLAFLLAHNPKP